MKKKNSLNKENKKEIKKLYREKYHNTELQVRLVRLLIYAGIGYFTTVIILIDTMLNEKNKIGSCIIAITLFIASTVFLIGHFTIKRKVYQKLAKEGNKKVH